MYCGASHGKREAYRETAELLGQELLKRGLGLVYGGGSVGLMGIIADTVMAGGGEVIGVIPEGLMGKEVDHQGVTALHVVDSMHTRKGLMAKLADGFIAMPGGLGTMEELFETWTWGQLGFHDKPCGLLNSAGYYDSFYTFLDNMVAEGFVRPKHRGMLMVADEPAELLDLLANYKPPTVKRWLDETDL